MHHFNLAKPAPNLMHKRLMRENREIVGALEDWRRKLVLPLLIRIEDRVSPRLPNGRKHVI
jgi:hypothetical protein